MASSEDGARWAAIGTALDSPVVKTQAAVWELERKQMMGIVSQFWNVESRNFKNFVENKANSDAVSAIVITSLEDTPAGFVGVLMGVCCPELMDLEALTGTTMLPQMFDMITLGKEKEALDADSQLIAAELPAPAMRLLHLARANALLNFLQNVLLLYQQVDVAVPHLNFGTE